MHLVLAIVPLAMAFVPFDMRTLPIVWALAAITFAQIMLLAIWAGMMPSGKVLHKLFAAILAAAFIAIWQAAAQVLMSTQKSLAAVVSAYMQNTSMILVLLALLSLALFGVSRLMGTIRFLQNEDLHVAEPRFRFSLLTLLAIATAMALLLGLVRIARMDVRSPGEGEGVVDYLLVVVLYGLNTLTTIWATLGQGHVWRRLGVVFLVSFLLGLSFAIAAGHSPYLGTWWFFLSPSVVVIVPTVIVVLSLLYLRRLGFRLVPPRTEPASGT